MSDTDSSHIDTVNDLVGFDMCQYLWVVRVCPKGGTLEDSPTRALIKPPFSKCQLHLAENILSFSFLVIYTFFHACIMAQPSNPAVV